MQSGEGVELYKFMLLPRSFQTCISYNCFVLYYVVLFLFGLLFFIVFILHV